MSLKTAFALIGEAEEILREIQNLKVANGPRATVAPLVQKLLAIGQQLLQFSRSELGILPRHASGWFCLVHGGSAQPGLAIERVCCDQACDGSTLLEAPYVGWRTAAAEEIEFLREQIMTRAAKDAAELMLSQAEAADVVVEPWLPIDEAAKQADVSPWRARKAMKRKRDPLPLLCGEDGEPVKPYQARVSDVRAWAERTAARENAATKAAIPGNGTAHCSTGASESVEGAHGNQDVNT